MRNRKASDIHDVDLLVFTRDAEMVKALDTALDGSHRLHHVQSLEAAVAALEKQSDRRDGDRHGVSAKHRSER